MNAQPKWPFTGRPLLGRHQIIACSTNSSIHKSPPSNIMNFICADVWFGVFAWFGRAELGLKLALLSWRFDALVDEYFRGRKWSLGVVEIRHAKEQIWHAENGTGPKGVRRSQWKLGSNATMFIKFCDDTFKKRVEFPHISPPANLIGFKRIIIRLGRHIDIKVIAFLSSIRHLFNANIILELNILCDVDPSWPAIAQEIWPLSYQSIDTLILYRNGISMLRNLVSPTVLRDCPNLRRIVSNNFPDAVPDDRAGADISKAVSMWLHTPRPDGRPKVMVYGRPKFEYQGRLADIKRTFANALSSPVSYVVSLYLKHKHQLEHPQPFDVENGRTKERLTFRYIEHRRRVVAVDTGPN
uniref:Uncharacterized protein n=1 Tax=Globodera rostochiensis TaxID=31243 RepID=A0A914HVX2_GLORO